VDIDVVHITCIGLDFEVRQLSKRCFPRHTYLAGSDSHSEAPKNHASMSDCVRKPGRCAHMCACCMCTAGLS
jgi:hypothetical protein